MHTNVQASLTIVVLENKFSLFFSHSFEKVAHRSIRWIHFVGLLVDWDALRTDCSSGVMGKERIIAG